VKVPRTAYCSIPGAGGGYTCEVDSRGFGSCGYFAVLPDGSLCPCMLQVLKWQYIQPLWIKNGVKAKRNGEQR